MAKLMAKNTIASRKPPRKIPLWPVVTPTNAPTTASPTAIIAAHVVLSIRVPTQPSSAGSRVSEASDHHGDGERRRDGDALHERQPDEQESEQRDDHGDAGEHHGAAAGVDRRDHRVFDARPAFEVLSIAGDDEQGVVDADAQADHRHHRGGEVGHRDDVAGERHERGGDAEAEQGDADRQAHGEHGAEGEDQDDHRRDQAVDLALGEFERGEQVAAVLDLEPLDGVQFVALVDDVVADLRRVR